MIVERNHVNQKKAQSVNFFSTPLFAVGYGGGFTLQGEIKMKESKANIVNIKASCQNCRNYRWQKQGDNERCYCTKQFKYLTSIFWNPVCIDFYPKQEVMQQAIDEMDTFYNDNNI